MTAYLLTGRSYPPKATGFLKETDCQMGLLQSRFQDRLERKMNQVPGLNRQHG